jgi:hypothetical protein
MHIIILKQCLLQVLLLLALMKRKTSPSKSSRCFPRNKTRAMNVFFPDGIAAQNYYLVLGFMVQVLTSGLLDVSWLNYF